MMLSGPNINQKDYSVAAEYNINFTIDPNMFHPGPLQYYMAAATDAQNLVTWNLLEQFGLRLKKYYYKLVTQA
jgi:hypothetical protein